jgi:penicillin amidase
MPGSCQRLPTGRKAMLVMSASKPLTGARLRRRNLRRWLAALFYLLLGVVLLCSLGAGLLYATLPPLHQKIALPGLSAPVQIRFDADGIPFIRAQNARDAAEALGYVHAQSRLFQMDLMRRAAGGALAELFGPVALDNDEEMRRLGIAESAAADTANLSPDARAMLIAYAAGVNAWITQRGRLAAPEYLFLGRPRPWTVTDSLLWGKMIGLWLSGNWQTEIGRLALGSQHPRAKIDALWPGVPGMLPEDAALLQDSPGLAWAGTKILAWMRVFPEPFTQPAQASNEFAVSGARTASGKPLLAGDPHLGFDFPSLWYLARIDTPAGVLAGATAPGLPFLIIGHNAKVAWTFTSTGADVQDVFIEHPNADQKTYATPNGPEAFSKRIERIHVRGHPDVVLTVLITRHGPVIGATPDGDGLLAVEMANLAPGDTDADGLLQLDRAQSVEDVRKAAALITSPVQNLLAADSGNIGFFTTGRVPIRKAGDGAWPVDGADGLHDWIGLAGSAQLPSSVDPASGELVNANNPTAGPDFPVFMGRDVYGDWRARRIRTLLAATALQTPASFGRIQLDVASAYAQAILPRMLALHLTPQDHGQAALALLRNWHGEMSMNAPQPLIFNAWTRQMVARTLRQNGFDPDQAPVLDDNFLYALLGSDATEATRAMWCGTGGNCSPLLRASLDAAMAPLQQRYGGNLAGWRWGTAHPAIFAHPLLGSLPVIGRFGRFTLAVPGDASTIFAAAPSPTDADPDGFTAVHGPELRVVFDLSDLDRSLFIIAPGESGNLLSGHAGDMLLRWRAGQYIQLCAAPFAATRRIELLPPAAGP